jgi:hypothetical protein
VISNAIHRTVAAALALVAIPAAILVATTATASAAALPVLHASAGDTAHVCIVLGNDGTTRGVVCIDLVTGDGPGASDYQAYPRAEMFCQDLSNLAYVQCADATADQGYATGNGTGDSLSSFHVCGHTAGNCSSNGRNYLFTTQGIIFSTSDTSCTTLGTDHEAWAYLGGSGKTKIELPGSGKVVSLSSNFETGHYFTCP